MKLNEIQKRFEEGLEKEHWEKLQVLLFSEDKESVVQGMSLIEQLDEEVYYDGVCSFLKDDGNGNWTLKEGLDFKNDLALKVEILRMAEENIGHEIKEAFENGCLDRMFLKAFESIETETLEEYEKERLLSKVSEMVEIKGGTFMMGSPEDEEDRYDDEVQHEVTLTRDFLMMKYAVTQVLWESVMGENPSQFRGASRPVETVSWFDCIDFANKLSEMEGLEKVYERNGSEVKMNLDANGYRLPTEAEWEYAARGGEYFKYAGSNNADEVAWYGEDWNTGSTHGVGQKKANGFGLYDMSGNVWEWVWDWYGEYPRASQTDPLGSPSGSLRVLRGGFLVLLPEVRAGVVSLLQRPGESRRQPRVSSRTFPLNPARRAFPVG
jgi:formylglycine-generating enzyme required for sulfatase activity